MLSLWESIVFSCISSPIILTGLITNSTIIIIIFNKESLKTASNLLSLPLFISGFVSSVILLPMTNVKIFIEPSASKYLCNSIIILHYIILVINIMTIVCFISFRLLHNMIPQFMARFSKKQVLLFSYGLICLVALGLMVRILLQSSSIISVCLMEEVLSSSLR